MIHLIEREVIYQREREREREVTESKRIFYHNFLMTLAILQKREAN
jgi:hypothetical protein